MSAGYVPRVRPNEVSVKAKAEGWPMPIRPPRDSSAGLFQEWARLYKRLRWVLRMDAEVRASVRPGARLARLRLAAKERGLGVSLPLQQYTDLIREGVCHYCGAALPTTGHGIDRKDSAVGYILENIVLACDACNRIKGDIFTYAQMLEIGNLLRAWRARGTWNDPQRKDRARFGGRPAKGDIRAEILAWNARWEPVAGPLALFSGSGDPGDGSGLVRECCGLYSIEAVQTESADEINDSGTPAMKATGPRAALKAYGARGRRTLSGRGKARTFPKPAENLEECDPFVMLRRFSAPGRVNGETGIGQARSVPGAVLDYALRNDVLGEGRPAHPCHVTSL